MSSVTVFVPVACAREFWYRQLDARHSFENRTNPFAQCAPEFGGRPSKGGRFSFSEEEAEELAMTAEDLADWQFGHDDRPAALRGQFAKLAAATREALG